MSALGDRRRRAREAANGGPRGWRTHYDRASVEAAIRVATEVHITDEVIDAMQIAFPIFTSAEEAAVVARAAFEAAGFDVS